MYIYFFPRQTLIMFNKTERSRFVLKQGLKNNKILVKY